MSEPLKVILERRVDMHRQTPASTVLVSIRIRTTLWEELEHYRLAFNCLYLVRCTCIASRNAILYRE